MQTTPQQTHLELVSDKEKVHRIAVVGSGISALSAAWFLSQRYEVEIFEKDDRLGGHTNTVSVAENDKVLNIDTGFIVFNRPNYPNLTAMFEHLQVATENTDMSFAVSIDKGDLEYSGTNLNGLFAQRRNLLSPKHWSMILEIMRFNRQAKNDLKSSYALDQSLGVYLLEHEFSPAMRDHYRLPMAAAIWSCPVETMMQFPTRSFLQFFANHGLLNIEDRPQWETVTNGSGTYIDKIIQNSDFKIHLSSPVDKVEKQANGVKLTTASGKQDYFDAVVLGCHADQAWQMMDDDLKTEFAPLQHFEYQENMAYLHTDLALMPTRKAAWSSWNFLRDMQSPETHVAVSYWMNQLQNLDTDQDYMVTLNPIDKPDPAKTLKEIRYEHPVFDKDAMQAQSQLMDLQGRSGIWLCGSYFGYGFHEDGLKSSVDLARLWNLSLPWEESEEDHKQFELDLIRTASNAASDKHIDRQDEQQPIQAAS